MTFGFIWWHLRRVPGLDLGWFGDCRARVQVVRGAEEGRVPRAGLHAWTNGAGWLGNLRGGRGVIDGERGARAAQAALGASRSRRGRADAPRNYLCSAPAWGRQRVTHHQNVTKQVCTSHDHFPSPSLRRVRRRTLLLSKSYLIFVCVSFQACYNITCVCINKYHFY